MFLRKKQKTVAVAPAIAAPTPAIDIADISVPTFGPVPIWYIYSDGRKPFKSWVTNPNGIIADLIIKLRSDPVSRLAQFHVDCVTVQCQGKTLRSDTRLADLVSENSYDNPLLVVIPEPSSTFSLIIGLTIVSARPSRDVEFIANHNLNLNKPEDAAKFVLFRYETWLGKNPPYKASFEDNGLEYRLDKRLTEYAPTSNKSKPVELLLGITGTGKTRMILEHLYRNFGYYFDVNNYPEVGSHDMKSCFGNTLDCPERVEYAIKLVYFIRVVVCNHLLTLGFNDPATILFAQIHPREFFGCDIFENLFRFLFHQEEMCVQLINPFPCLVLDDIQGALKSMLVYLKPTGKEGPFFLPLVYYTCHMTMFDTIILSGRGFNYSYFTDFAISGLNKRDITPRTEVEFVPSTRVQIQSYSQQYLEDHEISHEEASSIVNRIMSFELCHGRHQFPVFLISKYLKTRDIDSAMNEFTTEITSPRSMLLRLKHDLCRKTFSFSLQEPNVLILKIRQGLVELLCTGKLVLKLDNENACEAIRYGLGFGTIHPDQDSFITIAELSVLESLQWYIPFGELVGDLMDRIGSFENPRLAGFVAEYLVAYALVANYAPPGTTREIKAFQGYADCYISGGTTDSQVCFPDHSCGPDIIYKCSKTKTIYFCQVQLVNKTPKQEHVGALDTTDPSLLYSKRGTSVVNPKFKGKQESVLKALEHAHKFTWEHYTVKRLLFTSNPVKAEPGVQVMNSVTEPEFFRHFQAIGQNWTLKVQD